MVYKKGLVKYLMAEIISFVTYKNMKIEDQKKARKILTLSNSCENIDRLLYNINDSVGVSFVTQHIGDMNQIIAKEHIIDDILLDVILMALYDYKKSLMDEIADLRY